ncbi:YitT family protein [Streptomyces sp. NPDC008317]|uniref:membrane protein YczE n=1 Tax=Streptomyces sp. NPDC008317 TaxID=3364827 RepID=UPI0036E5E0DC
MCANTSARGVPLFSSFPHPSLSPVPYRRLVRLYVGLVLYGASSALMIRAALGLDPWDVFHQGLSRLTGLSIGVVSIVVGAAVLLLWWPIRQRPGLGTVSNVFVVGLAMDGTCRLVPHVEALAVRVPLLVAGVALNGLATGLYITARFGPGPRDGLMTGLHRRTGRSVRLVRTGIEVTVLAAGFALGGGVGVGTVLYALAIGPLAQFFLRIFAEPEGAPGPGVVKDANRDGATDATRDGEVNSDTNSGADAGSTPDVMPASAVIRRDAPERAAVDPI